MEDKNLNSKWMPSAVPFFVFGFLYYLLIPPFAFLWLNDNTIVAIASDYIRSEFFDVYYAIDCVVVAISWFAGYLYAQRISYKINSPLDIAANRNYIAWLLIISLGILVAYNILTAISAGTVLFSGYGEEYNTSLLGTLATALFTTVIFHNFFTNLKIKQVFIRLFIIISILMLGLGSRMFFVLGSISLLVGYISNHPRSLNRAFIYLIFGLLFFLMIILGVMRQGADFTLDSLIDIAIAEPVFTSTSGGIYFNNIGARPLLQIPYDLIASFVNFIPSTFYPAKMELIISINKNDDISSPFGASSLLLNIYSNFGVVYPLFMMCIGFFYGYLRKKGKSSHFFKAVYFSVLPLLMFHFFREGYITVIKVMFFNSLIFPFLCLYILLLISRKSNVQSAKIINNSML